MNMVLRLVKGSSGKPLHPTVTDVSVGAYILGVAALIAGRLACRRRRCARGADCDLVWVAARGADGDHRPS